MNERDHIQRDKTASSSAAESSPKDAMSRRPTDPMFKAQGNNPQAEGSAESSLTPAQPGRESQAGAQPKPMVTMEYKHSIATRWMHWINFPLLFVMIYSGILIYWADSQHEGLNAHRVYRIGFGDWTLVRLFPTWFYNSLHLRFQLAKGLSYHFFFMWFFALNGVAYVLHTFLSGEWRNLAPNRRSFAEALQIVLHDLGMSKYEPPRQKFNGAQRIAYTGVILMGAGSLLTGLAIYKPTQLHVITALLGGYEMARLFHFWLTIAYVGFFLVHVAQVVRAGWNNFRAMIIGYQVSTVASPERDEVSDEQDIPAR